VRADSAIRRDPSPASTAAATGPSAAQPSATLAPCGTEPAPNKSASNSPAADIEVPFPGAKDDSDNDATSRLMQSAGVERVATRAKLDQRAQLPESTIGSFGGLFGEKLWTLPETADTVHLDLTREGSLESYKEVSPGVRRYDGGEAGARTLLQQLPGNNVRIYKVIEHPTTDPAEPTEFTFRFELGCNDNRQCSKGSSFCFFGPCQEAWTLSREFTYAGSEGVLLMDPNEKSDITGQGAPRGFVTAPTVRDQNGRAVYHHWDVQDVACSTGVLGGTVKITGPPTGSLLATTAGSG
jgi:hypothetical protein